MAAVKKRWNRSDVGGNNVNERHKERNTIKQSTSTNSMMRRVIYIQVARSLMGNHIIAWVKQCVEISIYATDRTYLNLALHACKNNLTDISEEKCLKKLESRTN